MSGAMRESIAIVLAGKSQTGKNKKIVQVFDAKEKDGSFPFRPAAYIRVEQSGNATTARMLQHKDCVVFEATTAEDVVGILENDIPKGHPQTGEAFRLVALDGWTQLAENTIGDAREQVIAEQPKQRHNFQMHSARATGPLRDALKAWNAASLNSDGVVFISTCVVEEKWIERPGGKQGERTMVGWQLALPPKPGQRLLLISSTILYCLRKLPEIDEYLDGEFNEDGEKNAQSLEEDWKSGEIGHRYLTITRAVIYQGFEIDFVKMQDNLFRTLPVLWRNADLGAALLQSPLYKSQPKDSNKAT